MPSWKSLIFSTFINNSLAKSTRPENACYSFIQITDPQFGYGDKYVTRKYSGNWTEELNVAKKAMWIIEEKLVPKLEFENRPLSFISITGDLVNDQLEENVIPTYSNQYNLQQIYDFKQAFFNDNSTIPRFVIPGNHDLGKCFDQKTIDSYKNHFGPNYYYKTDESVASNQNFTLFLHLDSNLFVNGLVSDHFSNKYCKDISKVSKKMKKEASKMVKEQLKFLNRTIKKFQSIKAKKLTKIVIFQHHKMFIRSFLEPDFRPPHWQDQIPLKFRRKLDAILPKNIPITILNGHVHMSEEKFQEMIEMKHSSEEILSFDSLAQNSGSRTNIEDKTFWALNWNQQYDDFGNWLGPFRELGGFRLFTNCYDSDEIESEIFLEREWDNII